MYGLKRSRFTAGAIQVRQFRVGAVVWATELCGLER